MNLKCLLIIGFVFANLFANFGVSSAQDYFSGGQGSNLTIKEGEVSFVEENLNIKLHIGFAEIEQNYIIKNLLPQEQKVVFGFAYNQNNKSVGVDNILVQDESGILELISAKETKGENLNLWKQFTVNFSPNQTKNIILTHWQLNGANLRGLRTFNYNLTNKEERIGKLKISLLLCDQIEPKNFDKFINPDLDLQLEPVGALTKNNSFNWEWQNITPAFNLQANFYWPSGDLAKISQLNTNMGLYDIKINGQNNTGLQIADSSYLTAFKGLAHSASLGEQISVKFSKTRSINQFMIIPGQTDSLESFQSSNRPKSLTLTFDDDSTKTIELENTMKAQYFSFDPTITQNVQISVNSAFTGNNPNDTSISISEVEFSQIDTSNPELVDSKEAPKITIWQHIANFFENISNWFKGVF